MRDRLVMGAAPQYNSYRPQIRVCYLWKVIIVPDELSKEMLASFASKKRNANSWFNEVEAALDKAEHSRSENAPLRPSETAVEFSTELLSSQDTVNAKKCAACGYKCIEGCS
jgi:hypothetical protein